MKFTRILFETNDGGIHSNPDQEFSSNEEFKAWWRALIPQGIYLCRYCDPRDNKLYEVDLLDPEVLHGE